MSRNPANNLDDKQISEIYRKFESGSIRDMDLTIHGLKNRGTFTKTMGRRVVSSASGERVRDFEGKEYV